MRAPTRQAEVQMHTLPRDRTRRTSANAEAVQEAGHQRRTACEEEEAVMNCEDVMT